MAKWVLAKDFWNQAFTLQKNYRHPRGVCLSHFMYTATVDIKEISLMNYIERVGFDKILSFKVKMKINNTNQILTRFKKGFRETVEKANLTFVSFYFYF